MLPDVLHSVRSMLCTTTNETPQERLFKHKRRSSFGVSVPTWLSSPGRLYLRRHANPSKYDPVVEEVDLVHATPSYARVRFPTGRETTVSLRDIAPSRQPITCSPDGSGNLANRETNADACELPDASYACNRVCDNGENPDDSDFTNAGVTPLGEVPSSEMSDKVSDSVRRSTRQRKPVDRYGAVSYIQTSLAVFVFLRSFNACCHFFGGRMW